MLGVDTASNSGLAFAFAGASIFTRQTFVKVPGDSVTLTAIPSSFDMASFDEMFRATGGQLQRWVSAPPIVFEGQVLKFSGLNDTAYTTTGVTISNDETNAMLTDFTWALPQMTGSTFQTFGSAVRTDHPAAGVSVTMMNTGQITVGRFAGLTSATGNLGFSRWQYRTDGTVVAGLIMLDEDFDKSKAPTVRAVRTHELGHALGYNHVVHRQSVMNAVAAVEPNAADLAAAKIAFLRQPGSRSPDVDPGGSSTNGVSRLFWSEPIR